MGLKRVLTLRDVTLLSVVAVVNVNILPVIAAQGWQSITLWGLALVLFLLPQALAVGEFGKIEPGEGGIYLWTRKMFGDGHAFLSGWCYWTNNLLYIPSIIFILIGVSLYAGGPSAIGLADHTKFMAVTSLSVLWLITFLHIVGLGTGKWLNNLGAFAVWLSLAALLVAAVVIYRSSGSATPFTASALLPSFRNYDSLSTFSITLYSLVGLELAAVMGDEIRDPKKIIRPAALLSGALSFILYAGGTAALLIAVSSQKVRAIQGLMQAVVELANSIHMGFLIPVSSVLLAFAVLGVCSAWLSGSARIPFVMGIDVYLPAALGKVHPRWQSPYVALLVQGIVSSIFIVISLYGATVGEAYKLLLLSSVVIQLIPFLYLFAGLFKLGRYRFWAIAGFVATAFGIGFVFVPAAGTENKWLFEGKLCVSTILMLGIGGIFYAFASRKARV